MLKKFYPDRWIDSTYDINFEQLYEDGYRGVLFDIDNTLVPHGAPADERAVALFRRLDEIGFKYCLISNNKEERVMLFNQDIGSAYIYKANKPSRQAYRNAMEKIGTNVGNTVFVGDQLFTDVYGAKRTGILNILVKPMNPKEEIQIVVKRYLEKIVLHYYQKDLKKKKKTVEKSK